MLSEAPFDAAAIEAATRAVLPAIEIIGTYFDPWAKAGAPNLASDNAAFGYWIMGVPVTNWSGLDLLDGPVTISIDGEVRGTGKGRNVDDGAFGATAWLGQRTGRAWRRSEGRGLCHDRLGHAAHPGSTRSTCRSGFRRTWLCRGPYHVGSPRLQRLTTGERSAA